MIVTVTERGEFKRCRKRWDYNSHNRQSLQPISVPTALNLGSMIHKTLEMWIENPAADGPAIFIAVASEYKDALEARYLEAVGAPISEVELEGFYNSVSLGRAMISNYAIRWGSPIPRGFKIVQPEQTIVVPIPGTEHTCEVCDGRGNLNTFGGDFPTVVVNEVTCPPAPDGCGGTGTAWHYLEATLDFLAQDPNGVFWIGEHKTYGQRPQMLELEVNDQFTAYDWAVTQLGIGPVGGLLYDGMWKRENPPRGKDFNDLFIREFITRSNAELHTFEQDLRNEVFDMADPNLRIYRNRPWMGCWDCSFRDLCDAEARDEDTEWVLSQRYMKRENVKLWAADVDVSEIELPVPAE